MYKLSPFSYSFSGQTKKIFLKKELVFKKNEIIAIVGPSGGGKSTLLKVLKGIIPEYLSGTLQGVITFEDRMLTGLNFQENLRKILYLFQNPFSQLIYPTTEEEFLFSMENFNFTREKMTEEKEKFEKLFGLEKLWGKKTSELSNGECQKLVLASLLAIDPEVLLLDEPTAFLDPESRSEFYQFLHQIKKDRLLIIVDHHLEEIKDIVTRIIEVDINGEISEKNLEHLNTSMSEKAEVFSREIELPKIENLALRVSDLSYSYDRKTQLLNNINLNAEKGEIVAIKGKNGIGKSTLFKILSGVVAPFSGEVRLKVGSTTYLNTKNISNVGFVFQNPETHFFFDSIKEELKQSFKRVGSEELKNHLLENFFHDIDLEKSPFLLSEGEKRRLSILMTVFLGKSLILYDEPTFGQDQQSINEISALMKELKKSGIIQIMISHDEKFISATADHTYSLDQAGLHEIPRA